MLRVIEEEVMLAYINHLRSAFEEMMDPLREGWRPSLVSLVVSLADLLVSKAEL